MVLKRTVAKRDPAVLYSVATFLCTNLLCFGTILVAGHLIMDYEHFISVVGAMIHLRAGHPSNRGLTPDWCKIFSVLQRVHSGSRVHPA